MKNKMDYLIKDGLVYDGTISEPFIADIAIKNSRILSVGSHRDCDADIVINASGFSVAPGFIDAHAHSDFTIIADPRAEGKICQGITTEINGNCGMSAAPLFNKAFERREDDLRELGIKERWNTLSEYFRIIETKGFAINMAVLAGHGNIRGSVVGYDNREATPDDLSAMTKILEDAIVQGAIGLSTGLIYPPGLYSSSEEITNIIKCIKQPGLIYTSHMRSEGSRLLEAIQETLRIGSESEIKVHISHIKTSGEKNWHKAAPAISMIEEALISGVKVTCDRYPYVASSTDLDSLLPAWTFEGGNEDEIRRLMNNAEREKIRHEISREIPSKDYWEKVIVSSVVSEKYKWIEGKNIAEISSQLKTDEIDTVFMILIEERLRAGAIFMSMSEENLKKFIKLPYCMIGSDSSARSFDGITKKGKPHPRGFGTFPRFLGRYARDKALMNFSEGIYKSTLLPAKTFGLINRGQIKEGMYADLVIFDHKKIIDTASFNNPFQRPVGVHYVFVNGIPALWEGEFTGEKAGNILKHSKVIP